MTSLYIDAFMLPKAGSRLEECQDAWSCDLATGRIAIADGASDAFESRRWAEALANAYVAEPPRADRDGVIRWVAASVAEWNASIRWNQLKWYQEEKARRGTFATLLGLSITMDTALSEWHAIALGDACLFHIQNGRLMRQFPEIPFDAFGVTPGLLSNRPDYNQRSLSELAQCTGNWSEGDLFVLATDALAAALVGCEQRGNPLWDYLRMVTQPAFAELVEQLRGSGALRNDDVTLVRVYVDGPNDTPELTAVADSA